MPKETCCVCWTSSWQPCEEGYRNAVRDGDGWMFCGYCQLQESYLKLNYKYQRVVKFLDWVSQALSYPADVIPEYAGKTWYDLMFGLSGKIQEFVKNV
jgi:hypothetical protein